MSYELFVPRRNVTLVHLVDAEVKALNGSLPPILHTAFGRVDENASIPEGYSVFTGKSSGIRSAIIFDNNKMYKIKGCRPSEYTNPRTHESFGSQTLSRAEWDVERTLELSEVFYQEGITYPLKPVGYFIYPFYFGSGEVSLKKKIGYEPLTATIFEVKGDTRVDELIAWLEEDVAYSGVEKNIIEVPEIQNLFSKLNAFEGRLLRILHDAGYTWGSDVEISNAGLGNYVVFEENGKFLLGIADVDSCIRWEKNVNAIDVANRQPEVIKTLLEEGRFTPTQNLQYAITLGEYIRLSVAEPLFDWVRSQYIQLLPRQLGTSEPGKPEDYPLINRKHAGPAFGDGYANLSNFPDIPLKEIKNAKNAARRTGKRILEKYAQQ